MKALTAGFENYDGQEFAKPAAMYVLQHFHSSLEKKITQKHYVKKTPIDMMLDEQPDLDKIIRSEIEFVVDKVRFNADWFTTDAYLKLSKRYFTEFLDENKVIQESFEALQSNLDDTSEQFSLMINTLKELRLMLRNSYDQWHRKIMAEFLESDLPLEMYNLYNISYIAKISAVNAFVADLTKLQTKMYLVRSDERKMTFELKEFEKRHRRLSEMLMRASRSESALRFFLKTANAEELEDLFKTKPLTLNSDIERRRFKEYLDEFTQNLFELTNHLGKTRFDKDMMLNSSDSESFDDFDKRLRQIVLKYA